MKKHNVAIIFLLITVFLLSSCSFSKGSNLPKDETVGIVMPSKTLDRWARDASYLQEKFEGQGYTVDVAFSDNSSEQQVAAIQKMIDADIDVLIIAAVDGQALVDVLENAKAKSITVIAYDRLIMNTDAVSYYVTFDNFLVGKLQGDYIIENLKLDENTNQHYTMEIFAGDQADNNALYFYNGAMSVLEPYISSGNIEIVSGQQSFADTSTDKWLTEVAEERMLNILQTYYSDGTSLDIALCSNDSTARGVTNAIEVHDPNSDFPLITGQDGDEANLKNILDGKQSMTVFKEVSNEAAVTLNLVIFLLNGEIPNKALISSSGWSFGCSFDTTAYDNGKLVVPSYLITPEVVTADNYKKLLVKSGYYVIDDEGYLQSNY